MEKKFKDKKIESLISRVFSACAGLTKLTGRPFTPDGHMVGSTGEVYAERNYEIILEPPSNKRFDGRWLGHEVQIKTTGGAGVTLKESTELLLVFKVSRNNGKISEEVYNGDGKRPWESLAHKNPTKNTDKKSISLNQLRVLKDGINPKDKIPKITS